MKDADFNISDMLIEPPLIKAKQTPQDIVGHYSSLLKEHLRLTWKCNTTEEHERYTKKISEPDRQLIKELYQGLRDNGYTIDGLDSVGRIKIRIVIAKDILGELIPVEKLTKSMITAFRKQLESRQIGKRMPRLTKADYAYERMVGEGL